MTPTTKERIFTSAAELFAEKGYHAVSIQDIAAKAGIIKSSVYNHYSSKEEIMDSLLDYYLERMDQFYQRMRERDINVSGEQELSQLLRQLILSYETYELKIMYQLTRIVHHEQFNFPKAGEALIGDGYRKYLEEHVHFFDRLSDAGFIKGKERNRYYGELFARVSLTFATQFLHPEVTPTMESQNELYDFLIDMVTDYESHQ